MKRLNRVGLLEAFAKAVLTNGLAILVTLTFSALLLLALWVDPTTSLLPQSWIAFFAEQKAASSIGAITLNAFLMVWKKTSSLKLDDYLCAPDYIKLAGDEAEIEADFKRILEALEERDCKLALFVDDLDRCAPTECAEVVEALNTFFGSEGRECLFILGMHREMVASALDVAYQDLVTKIEANELLRDQRPFGRRFLEKIVQFVIALPEPDENATNKFLNALTSGQRSGSLEDIKDLEQAQKREQAPDPSDLKKAGRRVQNFTRLLMPALSSTVFEATTDMILDRMEKKGVDIDRAKQEAQKLSVIRERIEERKNANENEYVSAFHSVRDVIRSNPRQYKRFFNKLRFYRLLNVAENNPMLVDACDAIMALEHPELHTEVVKNSRTFATFSAKAKQGALDDIEKALLTKIDAEPSLKALRQKVQELV